MVHVLRFRSATRRLGSLRVWHLSLLVLYVAVAIVQLQDQRTTEPGLIALASAGFVAYGVLGWAGWRVSSLARDRFGRLPALVAYLVAMAVLFLIATIIYVAVENAYRMGHF
jgi:hypothetical protein